MILRKVVFWEFGVCVPITDYLPTVQLAMDEINLTPKPSISTE